MMTVSSGHSAGYLTGAVAAGRENYYTGAVAAGEPPGRWWGKGAEKLGLTGLVDAQDMTALYEHFIDPREPAFRDPDSWDEAARLGHAGRRYASAEEIYAKALQAELDADPERREQLRLEAGKQVRSNVSFLDATFSVQKSVTVLHAAFEAQEVAARRAGDEDAAAAWAAHRHAVESAMWAGNHAALEYLAEHAGYSRVGHHGGTAGRYVDAHEWVVASFFQHDNRNHDPQLHIHNAILNRVQGADGEWRTLDGRSIYTHRGAAAAVGERTMEEHLARSLGVRFATRPDGKAREVVGIRQEVLDLFSTRRRAITAKTREMFTAFETRFGRQPNALELDRLQRQATFATRRAKSHEGETVEERMDRWDRQLRAEVAGGLVEVADTVLAIAGETPEVETFSPSAVIETALADVQATKAAWTRADLVRAVNAALPDYLGGKDADQIRQVVESLADTAIATHCLNLTAPAPGADTVPDELRLADGASVYERPGARLYATDEHVRSERALRGAAVERGAPALSPDAAAAFVAGMAEVGVELGADQAAAVRGILTSGAKLEALVGPAGTGKSFVVGTLARAWQDPTLWDGRQRLVVGLAASQIATEVLAGEGLAARNITRWLTTQQRLANAAAAGDDRAWKLHAGDLVVVDESAMAATTDLTAIRGHVEAAGAKLLLVGDHRQLAAVGAGGGMGLVADTGLSHELAEVRRFTAAWERDASLRLREGDEAALADYRKHGRIVDAGTIEQAEAAATRAYIGDTLAGRHTLLITDTNEQAARVSAHVRAELVRLGRVSEAGVPLDLQGTIAGVGDLVQARKNAWHLANHAGNQRGPMNREQYRILHIHPDGGVVVAPLIARGPDGDTLGKQMTLPPAYVAEHLALGYASTVHSAQGLTVDTCHTVATAHTGAAALYVGMSRGRDNNTCYVTTRAVPDDAPVGATAQAEHRDPLAVLAGAFEAAHDELAATAEAEDSATRAASIRAAADRFADVAELATAARTATSLDRLVDDGVLTTAQRQAIAADEGMSTLARVLRQAELAGHDPHATLTAAVTARPLSGARSLASVLHHRITETTSLEPAGASHTDWVPAVDDLAWARHLTDLAHAADTRRAQLAAGIAEEAPQWAIEALGPVPDDPNQRQQWEHRAGIVAAHRELADHNDQDVALPGPPKRGQVEEYASWRAAWRALGRPEASRAEAEMSDGQLRVRVRAYEREKTWAPAYVANELAGTTQAEQRHRHTATIRTAEAQAATDPAEQARLSTEAAQAQALADALAHQREQLAHADHVRALWYAHTAETRAAAERARTELATRGTDSDQLDDHTTPDEWLTAHAQATQEDDAHRPITETDLSYEEDTLDDYSAHAGDAQAGPEAPPVDMRSQASEDPARQQDVGGDWTTVPSPDQTADAVARAQRALAEIQQRDRFDQLRAQDDARDVELARWHNDDQAEAHAAGALPAPELELSTPLD
ncbi:MobF family relaxase [Actinopolymorpha rutila]|uniref:Conjugative relaxase-like TrwC/TraI family protein n=1 Tax=Actinopolymorpha rutila TaxID=446787 RepID=A0A852Z5I0_9ACTN|nr:MobF family relaxase [Actinopolymorpha rutila]NYH88234.1 conjugative relaxase-like TrwC/TraI family protein [Actinopolymorpha rutila]